MEHNPSFGELKLQYLETTVKGTESTELNPNDEFPHILPDILF
jgi:hypothetical protein